MNPAELEERYRNLRAVASEHLTGDIDATIAKLICDGCGRTVRLESDDPGGMLAGIESWGKGPEGDLCPSCMEQRA